MRRRETRANNLHRTSLSSLDSGTTGSSFGDLNFTQKKQNGSAFLSSSPKSPHVHAKKSPQIPTKFTTRGGPSPVPSSITRTKVENKHPYYYGDRPRDEPRACADETSDQTRQRSRERGEKRYVPRQRACVRSDDDDLWLSTAPSSPHLAPSLPYSGKHQEEIREEATRKRTRGGKQS